MVAAPPREQGQVKSMTVTVEYASGEREIYDLDTSKQATIELQYVRAEPISTPHSAIAPVIETTISVDGYLKHRSATVPAKPIKDVPLIV